MRKNHANVIKEKICNKTINQTLTIWFLQGLKCGSHMSNANFNMAMTDQLDIATVCN